MGVSTNPNHAANDRDAGMAAMNRDLQDKGFLLTSTEDIINWAPTPATTTTTASACASRATT